MSHNLHAINQNPSLTAEYRKAMADGKWADLPHNWQYRITVKEVRSVFREKFKYVSAIAARKEKMPRGWNQGLTDNEKMKCYELRGFGSDNMEREKASGRKHHSERFYEIMRQIEATRSYDNKGWKGVYLWERNIIRDQYYARNRNTECVGLEYCANIDNVFDLAKNRKVHRRTRKLAVKFLSDRKIRSREECYYTYEYCRGVFPILCREYRYIGPSRSEWVEMAYRSRKYVDNRNWFHQVRDDIVQDAKRDHALIEAYKKIRGDIDWLDRLVNKVGLFNSYDFIVKSMPSIYNSKIFNDYRKSILGNTVAHAIFFESSLADIIKRNDLSKKIKSGCQTTKDSARQLRALGFVA